MLPTNWTQRLLGHQGEVRQGNAVECKCANAKLIIKFVGEITLV